MAGSAKENYAAILQSVWLGGRSPFVRQQNQHAVVRTPRNHLRRERSANCFGSAFCPSGGKGLSVVTCLRSVLRKGLRLAIAGAGLISGIARSPNAASGLAHLASVDTVASICFLGFRTQFFFMILFRDFGFDSCLVYLWPHDFGKPTHLGRSLLDWHRIAPCDYISTQVFNSPFGKMNLREGISMRFVRCTVRDACSMR